MADPLHRQVTPGLARRGQILAGADHAGLRPFDLRRDIAQRRSGQGNPGHARGLRHDAGLTADQLRHRAAHRLRPEIAELAKCGGVKGARLDPRGTQLAKPGAQLPGGARGESDREDLISSELAGDHLIRDAPGDGSGLAGAGTRQDTDRSYRSEHDAPLLGVEPIENGGVRSIIAHTRER